MYSFTKSGKTVTIVFGAEGITAKDSYDAYSELIELSKGGESFNLVVVNSYDDIDDVEEYNSFLSTSEEVLEFQHAYVEAMKYCDLHIQVRNIERDMHFLQNDEEGPTELNEDTIIALPVVHESHGREYFVYSEDSIQKVLNGEV